MNKEEIKQWIKDNIRISIKEETVFGPRNRITVSILLEEEEIAKDYFELEE